MTFREQFFENFLLRISTFGEFNDPFEMIPGYELFKHDYKTINSILKNNPNEGDAYYEDYMDTMTGARASLGVICFSSKLDNLLMWSHYANNHEGICVEFDAESPFFNGQYKDCGSSLFENLDYDTKDIYDNVGTLKKVEYSNIRPSVIETRALIDDTKSWLVKSKEWEYEDEYRIILPLDRSESKKINDLNISLFKIDKEIIKSVTMGCQVQESVKKTISNYCSKLNIPLKESFISTTDYKLDIFDYHPKNHSKYINMYNIFRVTKY
ncbi:DUF2971 domain-containing protein [Aureibacter tunicatorum]|uniref:DUF2971 domain-containing protein n=1 Tax=Aureibacter tunicatorum TaxID=866807 RepID=A0AAE3XSV1_9BACT|nr:DUF2971 domain-containing protein [Aureibacter tunicatorum]MDR6240979.1 hypothetical protein [Aureibacter tunicatorum]